MKITRNTASAATQSKQRGFWVWACLIATMLFVIIVRVRLLSIPLERDEGEFGYMGQLILRGIPPYIAAYNMKLPGIYAAYALIMLIFGQTTVGIHLGLLLINLAAIALIFLLGRGLLDPLVGVIAAASYAVMSVSPGVLGTAAHATHFVVLCAVVGLLLLLKAEENRRWTTLAWSGLLLGLGFTMKQCGAYFIAFGVLYLVWTRIRERPVAWTRALGNLAVFGTAAAAPFGLCCALMAATGEFGKFWFWTVTFPSEYGSLPLREGLANLRAVIERVAEPNFWLWLLAGVGLTATIWSKRVRSRWVFLLGLLVFSILSTSSGLYFRHHYFVVLLPALALLIGAAVRAGVDMLTGGGYSPGLRAVPVIVFAAALGFSVAQQADAFFRLTPVQVSRAAYGANPFPEFVEIARYVRENTKPGDTIASLGSEAELYFYTRRRAATSYIYVYSLMDKQRYARRMQKEMISQIESAKPKYIVFAGIPTSWLAKPGSEDLLMNWFQDYAQKRYEPVGLADIVSADRTNYYWDDDARGRLPSSPYYVSILRRKASGEHRP